jgi:catechol 2,3-dioxygenase-like lactoylglutathione lyase family enzyme
MKRISIIGMSCLFVLQMNLSAQECPPMYGFSKITCLVSSHQMAQEYYGDLLGFDKAFEYTSPQGKVVSYKVNDRQFLEFIEDRDATSKNRFISVTIQTCDISMMRDYLIGKNIRTTAIITDPTGNNTFTCWDERGVCVEFADMNALSLYGKSKGKYLSERRISHRIHHVGLHLNLIDKPLRFWTEVLGFRELLRIPASPDMIPTVVYYVMPGNTECIEGFNAGGNTPGKDFEHPCFVITDMQTTVDILRERDKRGTKYNPAVGRTNRWLLNTTNPDGTKVEFTEPYNIK